MIKQLARSEVLAEAGGPAALRTMTNRAAVSALLEAQERLVLAALRRGADDVELVDAPVLTEMADDYCAMRVDRI